MVFEIWLINGRYIQLEADSYELEDGTYKFYLEEEIIAEYQKNNIAGFLILRYEDEDSQDYD